MKSFLLALALLVSAVAAGAGEIQTAAASGDLEKVRALIKASPSSVNAREAGTTALHEATRAGHLEVVKLLVASGANVNAADFSNLTPLKLALGHRRVEIADFLRQNGGVEQIVKTPRTAMPTNVIQQPAKLFSTNASAAPAPPVAAPSPTNAPVRAPALTNKPPTEHEMMQVIFPIHEAARVGDVEQIKFLFQNYPDLINSTDEKGLTPLHVAAANRQSSAAFTLIALRAKLNARSTSGQTPLHAAVRNDDTVITEMLVTNRAIVDIPDNFGNTPLLLALQSSDAQTLDAGGGLASRTTDAGSERLVLSKLKQQQLLLATLLVRHGASANTRNRSGATPLSEAVRLGNEPVVNLLLGAGADSNATDPKSGQAPLHLAAGRGYLVIAEALLRNRASVNLTDARGETPLCHALREGRTNIIAALRGAGGNVGRMRPLDAMEQSLVKFYEQTESALEKAGPADKAKILVALNPAKADCERMFPKHATVAWKVVDEINRQIKQAFSSPRQDAEQGREIWRISPEPPAMLTQEWRSRGALAADLPLLSLTVNKIGATTRPGDYCFVNGHWVIVPPLRTMALQIDAATPARR